MGKILQFDFAILEYSQQGSIQSRYRSGLCGSKQAAEHAAQHDYGSKQRPNGLAKVAQAFLHRDSGYFTKISLFTGVAGISDKHGADNHPRDGPAHKQIVYGNPHLGI